MGQPAHWLANCDMTQWNMQAAHAKVSQGNPLIALHHLNYSSTAISGPEI